MNKRSVRDLDVRGKRVLVRVDFNVPVREGEVTDDTRIRRALPTIRYLLEQGAHPILISHLGRPKGERDPRYAMDPVAKKLEELLGAPVEKLDVAAGPEAEEALDGWNGEGVILLENSRFYAGERRNDPDFSEQLCQLADLYVNDAFGASHRAHATTVGVASCSRPQPGFSWSRSSTTSTRSSAPRSGPSSPSSAGPVSDKIGVIESLLEVADTILIGGAMCFTFFEALGYETGDSLVEEDYLEEAKRLLDEAGDKLVLPMDVVVAERTKEGVPSEVSKVEEMPAGMMGLDIGPETVEKFRDYIVGAKTIFWNGPMSVFEIDAFAKGTEGIARAVARSKATSIVGGGDSVAAVRKLGLEEEMGFISTGGGASLEYVEGKELPGIAVLPNKEGS
jgi:phosphoglycerate kinase